MIALAAQKAVIGAQRIIGGARDRDIDEASRRSRAAATPAPASDRAQSEIKQRGDEAGVIEHEEKKLNIRKTAARDPA